MILIVSFPGFATVRSATCKERRGNIVKFVKVIALVAFAAATVSLGACAHKQPAPAPASVGMSK